MDISPYCAARFKNHDAVADLLWARGATADIYTFAYLGDGDGVAACLRRDPGFATAERAQHDTSVRATVLHYAVGAGYLDIVCLLLEWGADPRLCGDWLVRFCIWRDRADILKVLLDAGLDPTMAELPRSGLTNSDLIALLSSRGVDCDPNRVEDGWPPIVFQSRGDRGGSVARIRDLIARGADVNARNYKGQTALHCAARAGFVEVVSLLLDHGAEVDLRDRQRVIRRLWLRCVRGLRIRISSARLFMFSQKQTRVWMNREMSSRHDVVGDGPRAVPCVIAV